MPDKEARYMEVVREQIAFSATNPRKHFDTDQMKELAASIKDKGILEPVLIREHPKPTGKFVYELIAGERRLRAARMAKLNIIPSMLRVMTDEEVLDTQITENLQRVDVHPLDEAQGYAHLKRITKLDTVELAKRVGKEVSFVVRRLQLNKLIKTAQDSFWKNEITLGHALAIARLSPEIQQRALNACFGTKYDAKKKERVPDKSEPVTVGALEAWVTEHIVLDLKSVPWELDDETLVPEQGSCTNCEFRSGFNETLFEDMKNPNLCTNPTGFDRKWEAFIARQLKEQKEKFGIEPVKISMASYVQYGDKLPAGTLERGNYVLAAKDSCEYVTGAVVVYAQQHSGGSRGQKQVVCVNKACETHYPKASRSSGSQGSLGSGKKSLAELHKRKQEIFDVRVAEPTRRQIFEDVLPTFKWPFELPWLNRIGAQLFVRLTERQKEIVSKLMGQSFNTSVPGVMKQMEKLKKDDLVKFMSACAFVDMGENPGLNFWKPQTEVVALAKERKKNYGLRDAEQRVAASPKKYMVAHEKHLTAVKGGSSAEAPKVYDAKPKPAPTKKAGKKAAKKVTKKAVKKR